MNGTADVILVHYLCSSEFGQTPLAMRRVRPPRDDVCHDGGGGTGVGVDDSSGVKAVEPLRRCCNRRPSLATSVLAVVALVQGMYILSGTIASEIMCDLQLQELEKDYERAQLVIKTLTLSSDEASLAECLRNVQAGSARYANLQRTLGTRLEGLAHKLEQCRRSSSPNGPGHAGLGYDAGKHGAEAEEAPAEAAAAAATAAASTASRGESGEGESRRPWLAIGIPTVARPDNVDYLSGTVRALVAQLPTVRSDPMFDSVQVVVMNNEPGQHDAFRASRDKHAFAGAAFASAIDFVDNVERVERTPYEALELSKADRAGMSKAARGQARPPDSKVQQQTRDVAQLLRYVAEVHRPEFYLFMEDDFLLCPQGLEATRYLLNRATLSHGDWLAIRASFGLNGILLHGKDLVPLATYLDKHQARRPPDHLTSEWLLGETAEAAAHKRERAHLAFRYNLLEHVGAVSTLRKAPPRTKFPMCWRPLVAPVLFMAEAFKASACPADDVWPCSPGPARCDPAVQVCPADADADVAKPRFFPQRN